MSQDYRLTLQRHALPTLRDWKRTLSDQGFPYRLDATFDPSRDTGYVASGHQTGFEFFSAALTPDERHELPALPPEHDWVITLCFQGDAERAAAAAALAALAKLSGGWTHDTETGVVHPPEQMLAYARALVKHYGPTRKVDHAAPAMKAIMLPVLQTYDFVRQKKGVFYRLREGIYQGATFFPFVKHPGFFGLELHAYCLAAKGLESTSPMFFRVKPKEWAPTLGMWDATTPERATASMHALCDEFLDTGLAFFDRMGTLEKLAEQLPHRYHLCTAHRACTLLSAGRVSDSIADLHRARELFLADNTSDPATADTGRWTVQLAAIAQLEAAVQAGTYGDLLAEWRDKAIADLKLRPDRV